MSSHCLRGISAALLLAGTVVPLTAQTVPTLDIKTRDARSKYVMQHIGSIQELPDGRVVAADTKDNAFRLVDLAKGEVALLGAQGDTANGYRVATAVFRGPGDSVFLYDAALRRFTHVTPTGQVATMTKLPASQAKSRRAGSTAALDATGGVYFTSDSVEAKTIEVNGGTRTMTMSIQTTETPIHRMALDGSMESEIGQITTRHADQMNQNGMVPYPFRDAWAVRSDGLMARVKSDTYQVIFSRDGKEASRTGALPSQVIALTEGEQKAYKDSVIDMMSSALRGSGTGNAQTMTMGPGGAGGPPVDVAGGGGGPARTVVFGGGGMAGGSAGGPPVTFNGPPGGAAAPGGPPAFNPASIPFAPFPAAKPAIPSSGTVAIFDANGNLWVARERAHGDAIPKYDVVAEGKGVIAHMTLPAKTRIVGFGKGVVYLARLEGEDEWLERYPLPKM